MHSSRVQVQGARTAVHQGTVMMTTWCCRWSQQLCICTRRPKICSFLRTSQRSAAIKLPTANSSLLVWCSALTLVYSDYFACIAPHAASPMCICYCTGTIGFVFHCPHSAQVLPLPHVEKGLSLQSCLFCTAVSAAAVRPFGWAAQHRQLSTAQHTRGASHLLV